MNLYVASEKRAYTLNAREAAPLASPTVKEWQSNPKSTMEGIRFISSLTLVLYQNPLYRPIIDCNTW